MCGVRQAKLPAMARERVQRQRLLSGPIHERRHLASQQGIAKDRGDALISIDSECCVRLAQMRENQSACSGPGLDRASDIATLKVPRKPDQCGGAIEPERWIDRDNSRIWGSKSERNIESMTLRRGAALLHSIKSAITHRRLAKPSAGCKSVTRNRVGVSGGFRRTGSSQRSGAGDGKRPAAAARQVRHFRNPVRWQSQPRLPGAVGGKIRASSYCMRLLARQAG
jgi:hypothetical protein